MRRMLEGQLSKLKQKKHREKLFINILLMKTPLAIHFE